MRLKLKKAMSNGHNINIHKLYTHYTGVYHVIEIQKLKCLSRMLYI